MKNNGSLIFRMMEVLNPRPLDFLKSSRFQARCLVLTIGLLCCVPSQARILVYVTTDSIPNTVSVVDTATGVITAIPVGPSPSSVTVLPDGTRAYVTNSDGTISIIDTVTLAVTTTLALGSQPFNTAVTPDGTRLYVLSLSATTPGQLLLQQISTATNAISPVATLAGNPGPMAVTPDGAHLVVGDPQSQIVSIFDTTLNSFVASFSVNLVVTSGILESFTITPDSTHVDAGLGPTAVGFNLNTGIPDRILLVGAGFISSVVLSPNDAARYVADSEDGEIFDPNRAIDSGLDVPIQPFTFRPVANGIQMAITRDGLRLFSAGTTGLLEIDTVTHSIVTSIPSLGGNVEHLAIADLRQPMAAYVANEHSNDVSVIDVKTNTVTASISVGSSPVAVAAIPGRSEAYIANFGSASISVVNTATNSVAATIPVGNNPIGIAVTADGTTAYAANFGSNTISVINTATNTVKARFSTSGKPAALALSPDGKTLYVAGFSKGVLQMFSTATNTLTGTVSGVGSEPVALAVTPDGSRVYIADFGSGMVSVVDPVAAVVKTTVAVGASPSAVAVTPDGTTVYVTNQGSATVSVIHAATNAVTSTIPTGNGPIGIAIAPDGAGVYVANSASNTATAISFTTETVTATPPVETFPYAVAVIPLP